ncbi:hypothetical protein EVG20_g6582 [Dentipellis fragilis]|uniref:Uncharacterized protein n=1 Tax=Dentipellis fragilis TaxID=205917 RepID=A0A4Y9YJM1_9AGAM|nr:hypothetical protein EVG20_g6582 [Dentipellis fragilis]
MFFKTSTIACIVLFALAVCAAPQVEERQIDSIVGFATSIAQDSGIAFASSVSVAASADGSGNGVIASTVPGRGIGIFGSGISGSGGGITLVGSGTTVVTSVGATATGGAQSAASSGASSGVQSAASGAASSGTSNTPNAAFALHSAHFATPLLTSVGSVIGGIVLGAWVTL